MFGLGTTELIIILVIVIMIFGVGKLPLVAKQLGAGMRDFQKSLRGEDDEVAQNPPTPKHIEDDSKNVTAATTATHETTKGESW